jgi:hypothetical protein
MAGKISLVLFSVLFLILATPASANIKTLNGQDGQDQTFQNDSNIIISSLNNIHALQWAGLLPVSRGGTGTGSFTDGSVPFIDGGVFSENSHLAWDNTISKLSLGEVGTSQAEVKLQIGGDTLGGSGHLLIDTGDLIFRPGGSIRTIETGGNHLSSIETNITELGSPRLTLSSGSEGGIDIDGDTGNTLVGEFLFSSHPEGTLQVIESINSTLYIGTEDGYGDGQRTGCLVMGDSDGDGVTYITANDGVLTASTTKPSICQ